MIYKYLKRINIRRVFLLKYFSVVKTYERSFRTYLLQNNLVTRGSP